MTSLSSFPRSVAVAGCAEAHCGAEIFSPAEFAAVHCRRGLCSSSLILPGSLKQQSWSALSASAKGSHGAKLSTSRRQGVRSEQAVVASPPVTANPRAGNDLYDCVIVGGGISGLCTAAALTEGAKDTRVLVTEARDRVGGNITTVEGDGYLWEEGPNSFQPNDSMLRMAVDMGLEEELVLGDPDAPRFVFWGGRLRPVPAGPQDMPFFDLMSPLGKLRAGFGALGLRPSPPQGKEESVEEFVRRNLGAEVFERLIEPFCSGVYAGNPANLSMKAAFGKVWRLEERGGSIIGGVLKLIQDRKANPPPPRDPRLPKPKGQTVGSFKKGLVTLPKAIAARLGDRVRLGWTLKGIQKTAEGVRLSYATPEGEQEVSARALLLTVPSYVAADLLRPLAPQAAAELEKFYYPAVAAVTISYPLEAIRPDRLTNGELRGFGQLHPRSQGLQTLGTIYSSSLFPGRAPPGRVLLLNYIGGATNEIITTQGDDAMVAQVHKDLQSVLVRPGVAPPRAHGVRVWPRAIPQFNVGHLDHLDAARAALQEAGLSAVLLGGNYVAGVALGRCVEAAYESAAEVGTKIREGAAS